MPHESADPDLWKSLEERESERLAALCLRAELALAGLIRWVRAPGNAANREAMLKQYLLEADEVLATGHMAAMQRWERVVPVEPWPPEPSSEAQP
ncbi:MAG: hypothetical protein VKP62_15225 [Candidatus Sericytochromatia bacterium]|nr:hypothetical protein [Candidatus Sericytochromatia bacterium]